MLRRVNQTHCRQFNNKRSIKHQPFPLCTLVWQLRPAWKHAIVVEASLFVHVHSRLLATRVTLHRVGLLRGAHPTFRRWRLNGDPVSVWIPMLAHIKELFNQYQHIPHHLKRFDLRHITTRPVFNVTAVSPHHPALWVFSPDWLKIQRERGNKTPLVWQVLARVCACAEWFMCLVNLL